MNIFAKKCSFITIQWLANINTSILKIHEGITGRISKHINALADVIVKAAFVDPPARNLHVKSCIEGFVDVVIVVSFAANKVFNAVVVV